MRRRRPRTLNSRRSMTAWLPSGVTSICGGRSPNILSIPSRYAPSAADDRPKVEYVEAPKPGFGAFLLSRASSYNLRVGRRQRWECDEVVLLESADRRQREGKRHETPWRNRASYLIY